MILAGFSIRKLNDTWDLVTCGRMAGDEHQSAQQRSGDPVLWVLITLYFHRKIGEEWIQYSGQ